MMINAICSQCGKDDYVMLVSERVSAGISTTEGHASSRYLTMANNGLRPGIGFQTINATQISNIAEKLLPPGAPRYKAPWGCFSSAALVVCISVILFFSLGVIGFFGTARDYNDFVGLIVIVVIMAMAGVPIWPIVRFKMKKSKERKAQFAIEFQRFQQAMNNWANLYHCSRCGKVFDPQRRVDAPTDEMMTIL